jgi:hypothetical protein
MECEKGGGTDKTIKARPTMALLWPHAFPHALAVLYAACEAKADSQKTAKTPSTTAMA